MESFDEYVKRILKQILESYQLLSELPDKPGDLDIIKKEWLKTRSLFIVLIKKIENSEKNSDMYVELLKKLEYYIENYDFEREVETMFNLYSEDQHRLRNIRLKILESFEHKKLMEKVGSIIDEL